MATKNMFCNLSDLGNESDVEQFFVIRLLRHLGYSDSNIKTKKTLDELTIGRGSSKEKYKPDYVCLSGRKPKIVLDAKSPTENISEYIYQVSGYALGLNQKFQKENPVRYTILTNGVHFELYRWDDEKSLLNMKFEDFEADNPKFKQLIKYISSSTIQDQTGEDELTISDFLSKPSIEEVKSAFNKCHDIIWKKEKISPTDAFYEFTKIIFVKLSEDKRIRSIIKDGQSLKKSDFKFSVDWLNEREKETEKPLSSILFKELLDDLQEEVERKNKKPIFLSGEEIELKTPTIHEVVKVLQDKDLYTIDEDLNGRMFETFLNATIRGRELGQYFTPRKVVKFMTKLANLQVKRTNGEIVVDSVLDACCGSGGFLIDAMADMIEKAKNNTALDPYYDQVLQAIKTKSIFGIDANPKISRIARINMYVHGDGGSRIFCADSLDKDILISRGTNKGLKRELEELRELLVTKNNKFDIVLTNPPFSMSYKASDKDEEEVLKQYASSDDADNLTYKKGTTDLKAIVSSNVLFIARYHDLLKPGGRMFIILDNSVLNSYTNKDYRDFIRENFIIKAIIQLPTHTFVNQEAGGITSMLYLEKKASRKQSQPHIFAREVKKVGHGTSGKEENEDDFSSILKEYKRFEETGELYLEGTVKIDKFENDNLFLIAPDKIYDRLDVYYHQPSFRKLLNDIKSQSDRGLCSIKTLGDFYKVPFIKTKKEDDPNVYRYIEISALDKERGQIIDDEWTEGLRTELAERAKLSIRENDVLFSKPYRSLKKVTIIPHQLDGGLASNGFYGIRPNNYKEACLLWGLFKSNLVQKQLVHLCSGYTQRELNDEYLSELIIPIPKNIEPLIATIDKNIQVAKKARNEELKAIEQITTSPGKVMGIM